MSRLAASAMFCAGLMLFTAQAQAQHRTHSKVAAVWGEFVRLAEVCAFGFWCNTGMLNSDDPSPARPLVAPKAKLARGIDRDRFRTEIADNPDLTVKLTHMVFGEVGRQAPLPVKIIQLETAFNRAQARGQTLAHVLLSVKEVLPMGITRSTLIVRRRSRVRRKLRPLPRPCSLRYFTARISPTLAMAR